MEDLEKLTTGVFDKSDHNKDGKVDMQEFLYAVEMNKKNAQNKKGKEYWKEIHENSDFSEDEYEKFKDVKILEIRQMIADGVLPDNYKYHDVPQFSGNFINATHIMVILEIYFSLGSSKMLFFTETWKAC